MDRMETAMGKRRDRFDQRQADQATARSKNAPKKVAERARRQARLRAALQRSQPPYSRVLRNWLAVQLGKRESQITAADVQKLLAQK
jgi:hypothetical protein